MLRKSFISMALLACASAGAVDVDSYQKTPSASLITSTTEAIGSPSSAQSQSTAKSSIASVPAANSNLAPPPVIKTETSTQSTIQSTQINPQNGSMPPIVIQLVQPAAAPAVVAQAAPAPVSPPAPAGAAPAQSISLSPSLTPTSTVKLPVIKGRITIPATPSLDIIISKQHRNSPRIRKLYARLGITGSPRIIRFVTKRLLADVHRKDNIFLIEPRSFQGILNYLSLAVEVTPDVLESGVVQAPKCPNGEFFNFNILTKGILKIHRSDQRPQRNVNVMVHYRNSWYYIADNDWDSKRTFRVVQQIFNLQAGEIRRDSPILTIPVR